MEFILIGKVPSKKNSYKQGRGHWYKPKEITDWEDDVSKQIMELRLPKMAGKFKAEYVFILHTDRQDLDNMVVSLNDALQNNGIVDNDRHIMKIDCEKVINKQTKEKVLIKLNLL